MQLQYKNTTHIPNLKMLFSTERTSNWNKKMTYITQKSQSINVLTVFISAVMWQNL